MPRPGTDILIVDDLRPSGPVLTTGQAFFAGTAERGPASAQKVASPRDYTDRYGARTGGSLLNDAVNTYFAEGGVMLYVSRIVADDAVAATAPLGTGGVVTVTADSPGVWGNQVTVSVEGAPGYTAAGDPVILVVSYQGAEVDRSGVCAAAADCAAFGQVSQWIDVTATGLPADGDTATLTTGTDGTGGGDLDAALARFEHGLGPGQVAAPGLTSTAAHTSLCAHADQMRRCALLDLPDTGSVSALTTAIDALQGATPDTGVPGVRYALALAPWLTYPGPVGPSTIVVPYSGVQAGLIARADATNANPNQAAGGVNGISRQALGLSQTYSDADRETLNQAGVALAKVVYGQVRTYGYRTAAGPNDPNWTWFGNSRLIMAIAWESDAVAENYVLGQIDGRHQVMARLESDLRGVCLAHYNAGALYGATPADAFDVDTGPTVNTDATIANDELHAVISLRCSPGAEWVQIEIVRVAPDRTLPNAPVTGTQPALAA